jgi:hypothetical protein
MEVIFHRGRLPWRLSSMEVIFHGGGLPNFQHFENCFGIYLSRPTNVTKHVLLIFSYLSHLPVLFIYSYLGNSVQFQLKLGEFTIVSQSITFRCRAIDLIFRNSCQKLNFRAIFGPRKCKSWLFSCQLNKYCPKFGPLCPFCVKTK